MRLSTLFSTAVLLTTLMLVNGRADDLYEIEDECDSENGWVQITLNETHDLLIIARDDDELVIHGLMFNENEFDNVPSIFQYSEDELIDMAEEVFEYDNSFNDIQRVIVLCRGGNDDVICQSDVPVNVFAFGEDGNDHLEGSMLADNLQGGPGRDRLRGRDGADILNGGNDDENDILQGDAGIDTFIQFHEMQTVSLAQFTAVTRFTAPSLRLRNSRTSIRATTTTTNRVDQETLVDFNEDEDILFDTEI